MVAVVALVVLAALGRQLAAEIHFLAGSRQLHAGQYAAAARDFKTAVNIDDDYLAGWLQLGSAWWQLAAQTPESPVLRQRVNRSLNAYRNARQICPIHSEAAYGMARAVAALAQRQDRQPAEKDTPDATALYREALRLRPSGITYRYALVRHLYAQGESDALGPEIRALCRIFPANYKYLKSEPFWQDAMQPFAREGLEKAAQDGFSPREANLELAAMAWKDKAWGEFVKYYTAALKIRSFDNRSHHFIALGRGWMELDDVQNAEQAFARALALSENRAGDLENIYRVYTGRRWIESFREICRIARLEYGLFEPANIFEARALIDTGAYVDAKTILRSINQYRESAEALYWMARIAEKEGNWDDMELHSQRAVALKPRECKYYGPFAQALKRQGKTKQAKQVMEAARRCRKSQ